METWKLIFTGVSAGVALLSAIASAVAWWRSREAKKIAEQKRDEAVKAAQSVASATTRIADVQESFQTAEASAQASSVVFVRSVPQRGFSGWKVENYSDQPVTNVVVRSATGAKIRVYNNDMDQLPEYVEHILGARQQSHRMFRPRRRGSASRPLGDRAHGGAVHRRTRADLGARGFAGSATGHRVARGE